MTRIIGITGGIASGKSRVSAELAKKGAFIVSADRIAHDILDIPAVQNAVRAQWGKNVFETDSVSSKIDRRRLAEIIFGSDDPAGIEILNQITHPLILDEIKRVIREHIEAHILVLDAPLLYETGLDRLCNSVIFVDADFRLRALRARSRGWSEEELRRRESAQLPLETKKTKADFIITNNDSEDALAFQLEKFLEPR